MNLTVVGLSHRTAPVDLRERLAIAPRDLPDRLATLCAPPIEEAVILSTCNRVELYAVSRATAPLVEPLIDFLSFHARLTPSAFQDRLYSLTGSSAARHLFRVAAGLDSMILGESEIAAQVKQAYALAHAAGTAGPILNQLFQRALHAAKEARFRTGISQGQVSIGSVVVAIARSLFGERLSRIEVLLWGAGKAAETTARHLAKQGIGRLWVVNRSQQRGEDLATMCRGGWLSWEQALAHLAHVGLAIVCTQAPHYVIDQEDLAGLLPRRDGERLCLIDLAVPRNVDPALRHEPGVVLYDMDDVQGVVNHGLQEREVERVRCGALIERQVERFLGRRAPVLREEVPC